MVTTIKCKHCDKQSQVKQPQRIKTKKFCSNNCRVRWHQLHNPKHLDQQAEYKRKKRALLRKEKVQLIKIIETLQDKNTLLRARLTKLKKIYGLPNHLIN